VRRYPGGQIVHADRRPAETEEEAKATALEARIRRELGVDAWLAARGSPAALETARKRMDDALLGSALGRLLLVGRQDAAAGITARQHGAGHYFLWLYGANARIRGWPSPNPRTLPPDQIAGFSTHPEDSPQWLADIRGRWTELYGAIVEADRGEGRVFEILKRVLIEDRGCETRAEIGALRTGLNAIDRVRGG